MKKSTYRLSAIFLVMILIISVLLPAALADVSYTERTPGSISDSQDGNDTVADLNTYFSVTSYVFYGKIGVNEGSANWDDGAISHVSFELTNEGKSMILNFDEGFILPIDTIVVKASTHYLIYKYDPAFGEYEFTVVSTLGLLNNGGQQPAISHVSFYGSGVTPSPSPSPSDSPSPSPSDSPSPSPSDSPSPSPSDSPSPSPSDSPSPSPSDSPSPSPSDSPSPSPSDSPSPSRATVLPRPRATVLPRPRATVLRQPRRLLVPHSDTYSYTDSNTYSYTDPVTVSQ